MQLLDSVIFLVWPTNDKPYQSPQSNFLSSIRRSRRGIVVSFSLGALWRIHPLLSLVVSWISCHNTMVKESMHRFRFPLSVDRGNIGSCALVRE